MVANHQPVSSTRRKFKYAVLGAAAALMAAAPLAPATVYTWKVPPATNTWNTSDLNWNAGVAWVDSAAAPNDATFNTVSASQTITLSGTIHVGTVTFSTSGWNLTGGTSITGGNSGATLTFSAAPGTTSTVTSTIVNNGGTGVLIDGGGTIAYAMPASVNTYAGNTTVTGSTLELTNGTSSTLVAGTKLILDGSTLNFGGFAGQGVSVGFAREIDVGNGGAALIYNNSGTWTTGQPWNDNDVLTTPTGVTVGGTGTIALGNTSGFSGGLTINNSKLNYNTTQNYSGATNMRGGIVTLNIANGAPTATTFNIGDAASANLGTFNLNGNSQQIAGLNSVAGTNAGASKNTVTSASAATLTLGGTGTYSYGAATAANSGLISGAISIVKSGSGTQTLGDVNSYTGTTLVSAGTLAIASTGAINTTSAITLNGASANLNFNGSSALTAPVSFGTSGGTLSGNGAISSTGGINVINGGVISPGNSPGSQTYTTGLTFAAATTYLWENTAGNAVGTAGTSFDQIVINGGSGLAITTGTKLNLNFAAATDFADPFWDSNQNWTIVSYVGGSPSAGSFASGDILLNGSAASFVNAGNTVAGQGAFSTALSGNDLVLTWTPTAAVPEPASLTLLTLGAAALLTRRRRR